MCFDVDTGFKRGFFWATHYCVEMCIFCSVLLCIHINIKYFTSHLGILQKCKINRPKAGVGGFAWHNCCFCDANLNKQMMKKQNVAAWTRPGILRVVLPLHKWRHLRFRLMSRAEDMTSWLHHVSPAGFQTFPQLLFTALSGTFFAGFLLQMCVHEALLIQWTFLITLRLIPSNSAQAVAF